MKPWIVFALCMTGVLGGANVRAASESKSAPRIVYLTWAISVDANGSVTQLTARGDKLPPDLRGRLEREIRSWRFKPGTLNGQAAPTDSVLRVRLQATPLEGEQLALRIASVDTGGYYGKQVAPRYPEVSLKSHRQGLVLLKVGYDGNGRVTDADVYPGAPYADKALIDSALAAVRQWTFAPEVVGGHPLASSVLVPVCFELAGRRFRRPKCDWSPPGGWGGGATETVQDGKSPVFDSALKLETAVAGRSP